LHGFKYQLVLPYIGNITLSFNILDTILIS